MAWTTNTTTAYVRELEDRYGNIRKTLYEAVFDWREQMRARMDVYGEWSREYELEHARFSALYTVIEDAGLEEDYQAWKSRRMQTEEKVKEENEC